MRVGRFYFGIGWPAPHLPANLTYQLGCITDALDLIMIDQTKVLAAVARLEAGNTAAIETLKQLRDSSKATAAQLDALTKQLADVPADTTAIETSLSALADRLNADADAIEKAVAANPAVPDLPPVEPAAPPTS